MGISATVPRDTVKDADGEPIEVTTDWYAQDADGNLWYLGEDSKELQNGKVTGTEGSSEAGVRGAPPGIVMPAQPAVGKAHRQQLLRGEAEDPANHAAELAGGEHVQLTRFTPGTR